MNLLIDCHHGIYLPQLFAKLCLFPNRKSQVAEWHVTCEQAAILLVGPEHDDYWEVWEEVSNEAYLTVGRNKLILFQSEGGDLFTATQEEIENLDKEVADDYETLESIDQQDGDLAS